MPVHDWTRVDAGIFHAFHVAWIPEIQKSLNTGVLPNGFYAMAEQHIGIGIADVLTLHVNPASGELEPAHQWTGGVALAEAPPRVQRRQTLQQALRGRRRTLAIRHVSGHRLVAMVEIVSLANKDRALSVQGFAAKAISALDFGVHLLVVDLLPPTAHDPNGFHDVIHRELEQSEEPYDLPADAPLTLASYVAGPKIDVFLEHLGIGAALPEMPLFLNRERYVNVPLEPTYQAAYQGMPAFWRDVLEGREPKVPSELK